ncbi:MAG TPA: glycerol-3-phosphate acyltransferase [Acidimicrobiales bacterium]|nr:glycerol-3-phosphate acyltransferase [Acidimicrobiales bacterium]
MFAAQPSPGAATAWVVAAYLIGTFPTALLVGRRRGVDPTRAGSGNPGATNIARTAGRRAGAITLVGDLAKGALAAGMGWAAGGHGLGVACGVAAVVGHVLPVQRRFRGGKGVATGAGMTLVLFPAALALAAVAFGVAAAATRTVGVGSVVGSAALPVAAALTGASGWEVAALAVCAVLIVARHRDNLARLRRDRAARDGRQVRPGPTP